MECSLLDGEIEERGEKSVAKVGRFERFTSSLQLEWTGVSLDMPFDFPERFGYCDHLIRIVEQRTSGLWSIEIGRLTRQLIFLFENKEDATIFKMMAC